MQLNHGSGFSLWELLLVCSLTIIMAPLVIPSVFIDSMTTYDEAAKRIVTGSLQQARSAGLAGRVAGSLISFESATSTFVLQAVPQTLPHGYTINSIVLDGNSADTIQAGFDPLGNVNLTPAGNQAVISLARPDGTAIYTFTIAGKGIPVPQPSAGTTNSGGSSGGGGGGCRWFQ